MATTLTQLHNANQDWFSPQNKKFFGDKSYKVLQASSGQNYLIRTTCAWSDMFDKPKTLHYRLNPLEGTEIRPLVDNSFLTLPEVKAWLRLH